MEKKKMGEGESTKGDHMGVKDIVRRRDVHTTFKKYGQYRKPNADSTRLAATTAAEEACWHRVRLVNQNNER